MIFKNSCFGSKPPRLKWSILQFSFPHGTYCYSAGVTRSSHGGRNIQRFIWPKCETLPSKTQLRIALRNKCVFLVLPCAASIVLCSCNLMRRQSVHSVNLCNIAWKMLLMHTCPAKLTKQWSQLCFLKTVDNGHTSRTLFSRSSSFSSASRSLSTPSSLLISSAANLSGSTCISFGIRFGRWGKTRQTVSAEFLLLLHYCLRYTGPSFTALTPHLHPVSERMKGFKHTSRKYWRGRCQVSNIQKGSYV